MRPLMTLEEIAARLSYCPESGELRWLVSSRSVKAGARAGTATASGYIRVLINRRSYCGHRLAWLLVHGEWPEAEVDHINGDRADNRLANLRSCSHRENLQNLSAVSKAPSGCRGVSWHRGGRKWMAQITVGGKNYYLGLHDTKEQAFAAYVDAKARLHTFQPSPRAQGELADFGPVRRAAA